MNIHEYQGKELLSAYGINIPKGGVAFTAKEATDIAKSLDGPFYVVKSQIHAGGRGSGYFKESSSDKGGVRVAKSVKEVHEFASEMLGRTLVTKQTGDEGKIVKRLYIENGCNIVKEIYLGLLIDRETADLTMIASEEGGMEIEEVARLYPEKIFKVSINAATGIQPYHSRKLAYALNVTHTQIKPIIKCISGMYNAFIARDCAIIEINPLVITDDGSIIALDAKVSFDENALFRQEGLLALRDENEENPMEILASKHELNYIKLDGNIGCLVNGAGLAMGTMDIIKLYGGDPANFLDVGGGANKERVATAFKLILSDSNVKAILVNIFGGIMRCDVIAQGIIAAAREVSIDIPLIVRLEGTNVEKGIDILKRSNLSIISGDSLSDAAKKAVEAVRE